EALVHAEDIYKKEDATQVEVDNAYETLLTGYFELRLKPDKSKLEDLINKVNDMDLSKYTDSTVKTLKDALNRATEVLKDEEASKVDVEKAVKDLELALANLEEKKGDEDNNGNNNGNGNGNGNGNNGGNNKPGQGSGNQNTGNKIPNTGMGASYTGMLLLGVAAVAAGGITLKKRKRDK
ncbi:LPXTG cell wall anchor domain-containing protein, partial [Clostridium sardiniense]|uniref:LPXTG cell wall anchor domain-containing protein n=1 Tax=Clostridium sardiniense TaxID=29369 RepID=UPI003D3478D0